LAALAVPGPGAQGASGLLGVEGHDVDLGVPDEPVDDVLAGRPLAGLDDECADAQLDTDGGRHHPADRALELGCELLAPRLAEDDGHGRRGVDHGAPRRRLAQRGTPDSSWPTISSGVLVPTTG
jgi:hypothetical protein